MKFFFLAMLLFACAVSGHAQQKADTVKFFRRPLYSRTELKDSLVADEIVMIQQVYRKGLLEVITDKSLSEDIKKAKVKALFETRNRQLDSLYFNKRQNNVRSSSKSL